MNIRENLNERLEQAVPVLASTEVDLIELEIEQVVQAVASVIRKINTELAKSLDNTNTATIPLEWDLCPKREFPNLGTSLGDVLESWLNTKELLWAHEFTFIDVVDSPTTQ